MPGFFFFFFFSLSPFGTSFFQPVYLDKIPSKPFKMDDPAPLVEDRYSSTSTAVVYSTRVFPFCFALRLRLYGVTMPNRVFKCRQHVGVG